MHTPMRHVAFSAVRTAVMIALAVLLILGLLPTTQGGGMEPGYTAADEALDRWLAVKHDLDAVPEGSPEATVLAAELVRLQDEYQALVDEARRVKRRGRFNGVWDR